MNKLLDPNWDFKLNQIKISSVWIRCEKIEPLLKSIKLGYPQISQVKLNSLIYKDEDENAWQLFCNAASCSSIEEIPIKASLSRCSLEDIARIAGLFIEACKTMEKEMLQASSSNPSAMIMMFAVERKTKEIRDACLNESSPFNS